MGKVKKPRPKILDMEIAIANHFNYRQHLIVPNLSWGMFHYELDLCILSRAGYATEVEIKTSRADLIKDKEKRHGHHNSKVKYLYFALPYHLLKDIEHVPERAGILIVEHQEAWETYGYKIEAFYSCTKLREARENNKYQWQDYERQDLLRLAAMRTWTLKRQLKKERDRHG